MHLGRRIPPGLPCRPSSGRSRCRFLGYVACAPAGHRRTLRTKRDGLAYKATCLWSAPVCLVPTPVRGVGDASPPWGKAPVVDAGLVACAWGCVVVPTPVWGVGDAPPRREGHLCTLLLFVFGLMGRSYPRRRGWPLLPPLALPPPSEPGRCGTSRCRGEPWITGVLSEAQWAL